LVRFTVFELVKVEKNILGVGLGGGGVPHVKALMVVQRGMTDWETGDLGDHNTYLRRGGGCGGGGDSGGKALNRS